MTHTPTPTLTTLLDEIEGRVAESRDGNPFVTWSLASTDVPRLCAALRYVYNEWFNAVYENRASNETRARFDERFGPQVASILSGAKGAD